MQPTKRSRTTIEHDDYVDRKKFHVSSNRKSIEYFEDLPNEVMYDILGYLNIDEINQAFSNLNQRFDHLLIYSPLSIRIDLSSMSKSTFLQYHQNIIRPCQHRIASLRLSDIFTVDLVFSSAHNIKAFTRLEMLILENIDSKFFHDTLFDHLISLPTLRSLVLLLNGSVSNKTTFYRGIFRLPALKYCKLSFETSDQSWFLCQAMNESSPIEHLIIETNTNFNELYSILSYLPQLRRLCWHKLYALANQPLVVEGMQLKHLTHLSIGLRCARFNQFEAMIVRLFPHLKVLHLSTAFNREYLDENRWEQLISSSMPQLRIFDLEHRDNSYIPNDVFLDCIRLNRLFTSPFWRERQWFFTHQCFWQGNWNQVMFYSTNPYRRKQYTLYGETERQRCFPHQETNLTAVRHVHIQGDKALLICSKNFPNATELTLAQTFIQPIDQAIKRLSRLLPLSSLTQLHIDCGGFGLKKLIHLLQFTPNVHTLKVYSISIYTMNSPSSVETNELFEVVSTRNIIRTLTIESQSRFEQIKLALDLCPRLQHLNMNIHWKDFSKTFEFLFRNERRTSRNLFSICLHDAQPRQTILELSDLSESKKWFDDYSTKLIGGRLYIWW